MKEKGSYEIEGDAWVSPDSPYVGEAHLIHRQTGKGLSECKTDVILRYLKSGDTRPLVASLGRGDVPSRPVLEYLALMLHPSNTCLALVPFSLEPKRRDGKKGRIKDPENDYRDRRISAMVEEKIRDGSKYEAAIDDIHGEFLATGWRVSTQTIRDAYDKHHRRPSQT